MQAVYRLDYLPPTLNEIIRDCIPPNYKGRIPYRKLKHDYSRDCAVAGLELPRFPDKVWLHFHWYIATYARDPADNLQCAAKAVLDGLVSAKIIQDDSAKVIQPPVVIEWSHRRKEGLQLTISDEPIFQLIRNSRA